MVRHRRALVGYSYAVCVSEHTVIAFGIALRAEAVIVLSKRDMRKEKSL